MMIKLAKDFGIKFFFCLLACFSLLTCGVEEYYSLPQVGQNKIIWTSNTSATADIPSIDSSHYYAEGYRIYYRIYLSGVDVGDQNNPSFSSSYVSDYNAFSSLTNPSNTSSIPTIASFSGRGYYELFEDANNMFQLSTSGGTLIFNFPTDTSYPYFTLNGGTAVSLLRNSTFVPNEPDHERTFRNTAGLKLQPNSTTRMNMDVSFSSNNDHAYVAMYIVAVGQNPQTFSMIYGKPTFISVFKLPNS